MFCEVVSIAVYVVYSELCSASLLCVFLSEVIVEVTEADYQQREGQGNNIIQARVSFSRDIVNPITVSFFPVTYDRYLNVLNLELPPGFPSRETGPEFEAQGTSN